MGMHDDGVNLGLWGNDGIPVWEDSENNNSEISLEHTININGGIQFENKNDIYTFAENYLKGYYKDNTILNGYLTEIIDKFLEILEKGSIKIIISEYICNCLSQLEYKGHLKINIIDNFIIYTLTEPIKKMLIYADRGGKNDSNQYYTIMEEFSELQKNYQNPPRKIEKNNKLISYIKKDHKTNIGIFQDIMLDISNCTIASAGNIKEEILNAVAIGYVRVFAVTCLFY